jgi:hypothetical protein
VKFHTLVSNQTRSREIRVGEHLQLNMRYMVGQISQRPARAPPHPGFEWRLNAPQEEVVFLKMQSRQFNAGVGR